MSPEHIAALIAGGLTILGGVSTQVVAWLLASPIRKYQRAFDRAEKQWNAQFRMIEATRGEGVQHVIKPLRYWLLCELSAEAIGPPGLFTPDRVYRWRIARREAQIRRWLEGSDIIERSLYSHETGRNLDGDEQSNR